MDNIVQVMKEPLPGSRIQDALFNAWTQLAWDGGKIEFVFNGHRVTLKSERIVKIEP